VGALTMRSVADDLATLAAGKRTEPIRQLGLWLHDAGGIEAMNAAFDLTIARHGYASVQGVNAAWTGIGSWE